MVWGLAFAERPWVPLSVVALVPLLLALDGATGRRAFLLGWLHGIVAWGVGLSWIVETLTTYGQLDGWLAGLALLLLAAYLGLYHALFAWLGAPLWRSRLRFAWLGLPALWVLLELARGFLVTGFPWNLAAHAWVDLPGALPLSAWIGVWGVSFVVLFANVALATAVARRKWELAALALLVPALVVAVAGRWGDGGALGGPERLAVIVQPDTPNQVGFDVRRFEEDYARLLAMSRDACAPGALLVWPESAAWPLVHGRDPRLEADLAELAAYGCPVLFNSIREETAAGERYFNSMLLRATDGGLERYDKRHLVPFGEYVPLRSALPFLRRIARNAGDFSPAEGIELLAWQGERLGGAICYEVVFPFEVAATVAAGATALVTVTNDAWYGDTAAPWQHLAAARFRAAESRRWLLRAAITGVSAAIAPDGSVRGQLGVGERGTIAARFRGRTDRSPFTRTPWLVPALCVVLFGVARFASRPRTPARGAALDS